jgi:hypothetical protein
VHVGLQREPLTSQRLGRHRPFGDGRSLRGTLLEACNSIHWIVAGAN